ncbi:MAG: hypothetical protein JWO40_40 [Candidatus Doudnabacteria bacterium]|nr:hypothetical protein [Candidatus Doudnabacteria bacterium]
MKYFFSIFAILSLVFGAGTAQAREVSFPISAYSIDTQTANLGTPSNSSTPTPKKTKTKKPKAVPKIPKTKKPSTAKPKTPKAPKKIKKPAAPKKNKTVATDPAVSTTADSVTAADLSVVDPNNSATINTTPDNSQVAISSPTSTIPTASSNPEAGSGGSFKGLTIAGVAAASGVGLMLLLKKFFFH